MIITSSVEAPHGGLLIVHLKVYVEPAVPVNVLVGLFGEAMVPPVPDIMLHVPVPTAGVFPANVAPVNPHIEPSVWSGPAFAAVGFCSNFILTSSHDDVHGGLLIVQRKT